jgi:hypothetical protein
MTKKQFLTAGVAISATALVSFAGAINPNIGAVLYTSNSQQTVGIVQSPGSAQTLVDLSSFPGAFPHQITPGPNGTWFVGNGPLGNPQVFDNSSIIQIDGLFSGAPTASNLAVGGLIQNPVGLRYDANVGRLVALTNPGTFSNPAPPQQIEGIVTIGLDGSTELAYEENFFQPTPRWQAAGRMAAEPGTNNWFAITVNGGVFSSGQPEGTIADGSVLHRFAIAGDGSATPEIVVDLSAPDIVAELGFPLTFSRGVTAVDNGATTDVYVLDNAEGIFKVSLDANGDFESISPFLPGLRGGREIVYDPFNNALVFNYFADEPGAFVVPDDEKLVRYYLDTGVTELLAEGIGIQGLWVVPAPGSVALLALGGLAATRRRR